MSSTFSLPVSSSSTDAYCPVSPIRPRTVTGSRRASWPATCTLPWSGWASVARIRTIVVLPAPFGPSTPRIAPVGTSRSTPSSAVVRPNRLTRPEARIHTSATIPPFVCTTVPARADTGRTVGGQERTPAAGGSSIACSDHLRRRGAQSQARREHDRGVPQHGRGGDDGDIDQGRPRRDGGSEEGRAQHCQGQRGHQSAQQDREYDDHARLPPLRVQYFAASGPDHPQQGELARAGGG